MIGDALSFFQGRGTPRQPPEVLLWCYLIVWRQMVIPACLPILCQPGRVAPGSLVTLLPFLRFRLHNSARVSAQEIQYNQSLTCPVWYTLIQDSTPTSCTANVNVTGQL